MCKIIPMAWFWPLITPFMKIFACGRLTIPFKVWNSMKKVTVKNNDCCRRNFFWVQGGGNPPLIWKFYTHPSGKETTHPSRIFDLVHLWFCLLKLWKAKRCTAYPVMKYFVNTCSPCWCIGYLIWNSENYSYTYRVSKQEV